MNDKELQHLIRMAMVNAMLERYLIRKHGLSEADAEQAVSEAVFRIHADGHLDITFRLPIKADCISINIKRMVP